jgi:ABC-type uncharacterized transport system involved in gliding motility auxiliary subunit
VEVERNMDILGKWSFPAALAAGFSALAVFAFLPDQKPYYYFLLFAAVALFILAAVFNWRAIVLHFQGRAAKYGTHAAAYTAAVIATLVLVNFLASRHTKRMDLTEAGLFTLSPQTKKIVSTLDREVEVLAFITTEHHKPMKDKLDEYRNLSPRVSYKLIDPIMNRKVAQEYDEPEPGTLIMKSGAKEVKVTVDPAEPAEEEIANGIIKLTSEEKNLCFTTGHGEGDPDSEERDGFSVAVEALEKENVKIRKLELARSGKIPSGCNAIVALGPEKRLTDSELKMLENYLDGGGKALFMLDPKNETGIEKLLEKWDVIVGEDVVIDNLSTLLGGDILVPVVTNYAAHPITEEFNYMTFFPVCRSVRPAADRNWDIEVTELARTSEGSSYAETDPDVVGFDEGVDREGPITLIMTASKEVDETGEEEEEVGEEEEEATAEGGEAAEQEGGEEGTETEEEEVEEEAVELKETRIVVSGDSEFASNAYFYLSGNGDLFLNTVNWLSEQENLISIRPKSKVPRIITLEATQGHIIFWTSVVLIPMIVLASGIGIWLRRRKL